MRTIQIEMLCASTFADGPTWLETHFAQRMRSNPRFAMFVATHQDKIRKKLRSQRDEPGQYDVAFELMVAHRLLADRGCALAYEAYAANKTRGPDFTATYKGHLAVNVEVRRLRGALTPARLGDALTEKLRQLPPGMPNVVVFGAEGARSTLPEPGAWVAGLRGRAEAHDAALFARHGLADASAFFRLFLRLSAVALLAPWDEDAADAATPAAGDSAERAPESALWLNPQAKHPLPTATRSALRTL
jgi:hypothetical protein